MLAIVRCSCANARVSGTATNSIARPTVMTVSGIATTVTTKSASAGANRSRPAAAKPVEAKRPGLVGGAWPW